MGLAKREWMRHEELVAQAGDALVKAGAGKRCLLHSDIIVDQADPEAEKYAYAIATNMVKAGEVDATREEFVAAVKEAIGQMSPECYACEHALSKD